MKIAFYCSIKKLAEFLGAWAEFKKSLAVWTNHKEVIGQKRSNFAKLKIKILSYRSKNGLLSSSLKFTLS